MEKDQSLLQVVELNATLFKTWPKDTKQVNEGQKTDSKIIYVFS